MAYLQPLLGIIALLAIAWLLSEQRGKVRIDHVLLGIAIQALLALIFFKVAWFGSFFLSLNGALLQLSEATRAGTSFVFGYLGGGDLPFTPLADGSAMVLALQVLPLILVMSALSAVLFYWRILPVVVEAFAWLRWLRQLDRKRMENQARDKLSELGLMTIQNINQAVETLSGGQRQGVAVARAAAFGSKVIIMDEPTAALGVKESQRVLDLILDVNSRGIPIILISHNMPHVFEVAHRIHIHRLGRRLCVVNPADVSMSDAVALMTGAMQPPKGATAA